jgi:hypothetical protein
LRQSVPIILLSVLSGSCAVQNLDSMVFKCQFDSDCAVGDSCLEGLCRSPSSLLDGGVLTGDCQMTCTSGTVCCNTSCVDLASDSSNCGGCGNTCAMAAGCVAGSCHTEVCDNGLDDTGNGETDCQNVAACPDGTKCQTGLCCNGACTLEATDALCSNGIDDDCNGLTDCDDPNCLGRGCQPEQVCLSTGLCASGCWIDDAPQMPGALLANSPCFACDPTQDIHAWSPVTMGATSGSCSGTSACNGAGSCRKASRQPCEGDTDCASSNCSSGVCQP